MVKLSTLRNIAVSGAFICIASGLYFTHKIQETFRNTEYYKKSMKIFRENRSIINYLGEPVKEGRVDLADSGNVVTGKTAALCVPVKGTKTQGTLCLWATRQEISNPWFIERMELSVKDKSDAKLLVYDASRDAPALVESKT